MADPTPPSIAVCETTDRDGVGGEGVKQSLESLVSRSDSASVDEDGDEGESSTLAVPSTVQGKSRETSRKGRKISLNVKEVEAIKEGYLDRAGRFQRWNKKYLRIVGDHLYLSKNAEDKLHEEIVLKDANVAENSTKNVNHSFSVITPYQQVLFAAPTRKSMEEWMTAFRVASQQTPSLDILQHLEGQHTWFSCSHHRRTYCNVCREPLHGVAWHGLSCEVCKMKSHRRCVFQLKEKCKWTTRSSLEQAGVKIEPDYSIPHMWVEGNLPAGSKCTVCQRACGSVMKLQDFRCVWCKWTVHTECQDKVDMMCTMGDLQLSILPPSALQRSDAIRKGMWEPYKIVGHSPVLAMVNSKSGDNQGVKFLRKLKYWLNPVQVFDLAITGPDLGLQLFQRFEKFRIIVFGGDGSVGWVLSAVDRFNLHSKTMLGVVPLGTGNDMARVMGWGAQFNDEEKLPLILREMEFSSFHLLDRWSIQYSRGDVDMSPIAEASTPIPPKIYRSPLLLPRTLEEPPPLPGPHPSSAPDNDPPYSPVNIREVFEADSVDRTGLEVCQLSDPTESVCELPPPADSSSPETNGTTTTTSGGSFDLIVSDLTQILCSQDEATVISSAQRVSQVVGHFVTSVLEDRRRKLTTEEYRDDPLVQQCTVLQQKLKGLQHTLEDEANAATEQQQRERRQRAVRERSSESEQKPKDGSSDHKTTGRLFVPRDALMARANSLKKAVRSILDMTEREIETQAEVTAEVQTLMCPVHEEPGSGTSPNLSPYSSHSSIDSGRRGSFEMGPQSLDYFEQRSSIDSGPSDSPGRARGSVDSGRRSLDLGLKNGTESGEPRYSRPSVTSLVSVVEPAPVLRETREVACMNNYFGIGLDAQIAYQFHNTREKNQIKSRTKNKMLYGILGGKEFFANSQKYLERKVTLECDGTPVSLPTRLQGLVFLNIPSYMAGTNFWGTDREKRGFSAPSYDDKLVEVVGITGITQVTTAKVLGIQNQRIAQCRYAKIIMHGPDKLPMQVDGEAWLQEPGIIVVSHKNKARIIFKNKIFSQSLESWKQKNPGQPVSPQRPVGILDYLTEEEIERYRSAAHATRTLMELVRLEGAAGNSDVSRDLVPLLSSTTSTMDRVFPDDQISETADLQHLEDFKREMGALVEETLYALDKKKISSARARKMREYVELLKSYVDAISASELSGNHYRRSSEPTGLRSHATQQTSPSTAHRGRASCMHTDPTLNADWFMKKIGKEVSEWGCEEVCSWLGLLGLSDYDSVIHSNGITGSALLDLQTKDILELGFTKVGHMTKLRSGIQTLNPTLHSRQEATKRARQFRETR